MPLLAALLLFVAIGAHAGATDITPSFGALVHADRKLGQRKADPPQILRSLQRLEVIADKADDNVDFTDYFRVRKDTVFLGAKVVIVTEEEYRRDVRGCCAQPSIGLILATSAASRRALERFAKRNGCDFVADYRDPGDPAIERLMKALPSTIYSAFYCSDMSLAAWHEDLYRH